ncbi:alpha/beta fold hydrolase [Galbitalea sp. SE-J8]|uniref:alpha/beta hydrolase family protein n=1 Tax=Galbitalea sp. SE-J8 TaxID=3054952 RepID=UPI00259D1559|nr:alpha/beta fold hydrolase [Galbitalea sp. SE-J8]MDM4763211.1 alpha/beta fold hydrolase [Galbitalea sp. SE-J8]
MRSTGGARGSAPAPRALPAALTVAIIAGGALAVVAAAASAAVATIMARRIVTPPVDRDEDVTVLAVGEHSVTISATPESVLPGRYSLFFDRGRGHARIGDVIERGDGPADELGGAVVERAVLRVDRGALVPGTRARISGWYYTAPDDLGLPVGRVDIDTPLGPAPAWWFPAEAESGWWVIAVHGRAVSREETLRAVPAVHETGAHALVVSYRNDGDAPVSPDGRYALGDAEWQDVHAAMRYAVDHGATDLVLFGFSMGGATVLQAATRSPLAERVRGLILDSPVVDWVDVLDFQGRLERVPAPIRRGAIRLMGEPWAGRLTGLAEPIDFARLDFVRRSAALDVPVLLMHSVDDGYVPAGPSIALARARPDIVTFERYERARHVKLWNYDPERWTRDITRWLRALRHRAR